MLIVVAIMFGGAGLLSSGVSSANAGADVLANPTACQVGSNSNSDGFCDDAGCEGGNVQCYRPPQGGMCYTSDDGEKEK